MEFDTILIADDSLIIAKRIAREVQRTLGLKVEVVETLRDAKIAIETSRNRFLAAITALTLSDSQYMGAVDLLVKNEVPTIVLTGTLDQQIREQVLSKDVMDYVLKNKDAPEQVIHLIRLIQMNQKRTVMVVDDSEMFRKMQQQFLRANHFKVLEAKDGQEGLDIFRQRPDISMVIIDMEMPRMNGLELVTEIRKTHGKDRVAIIGVSALDENEISVAFLKQGANDFLKKPFLKEEFQCRVRLNVEMLEYIDQIKKAAYQDYLTELFNRKYFFEHVPDQYKQAKKDGTSMTLAMIDIDYFKAINDTHGHEGGDAVLIHISEQFRKYFPDHAIVSRFGGEEFCIFMQSNNPRDDLASLNIFRMFIEDTPCQYDGKKINFTISCGVTQHPCENLEEMLRVADEKLYLAKEKGRNRVIFD